MKILFVMSPAFDPTQGGVQRTTYKMGSYFHAAGYEVEYYSLESTGHTVHYPGKQFHAEYEGREKNKGNLRQLANLLENSQPDVIINQMPYLTPSAKVLSNYTAQTEHVKLIACLRNTLFNFKDNLRSIVKRLIPSPTFSLIDNKVGLGLIHVFHYFKHRSQLRTILELHDYFVLLTPANRKELEFFVKDYLSHKVAVIPNSIPEIHSSEDKKENILLFVGKLYEDHKRADLLLPIWERVDKRLPNWNFKILGDGAMRKEMEDEIAAKGYKNVELCGIQGSEPYYERSKLFLMTSEKEGFPNVILEAQSYGTIPFLFNSYMAVEDIIENGKNGFYYPPFDLDAIADGIVEMALDEECRKATSNMCLASASKFTIENVGAKWVKFFDKIRLKERINELEFSDSF